MSKVTGPGDNTLYRPLLPRQIRVVLIAPGEESDPFDLELRLCPMLLYRTPGVMQ
jgi:hypothetical protein